ncbi:mitochondrial carrier homolog 1-like isoform X4 [Phyllopteryx taeniolatus]|uniref:mitochondrial carrier homolog 1-like isoform X4 n=1 Tax=Phyllopteryx taeniolatus TaxID=161469 RepID=UPI002AD40AFC|nr:mitochondrial carrier homolog 1-like isoform X4 [Phyllopteryx taeniolatus]
MLSQESLPTAQTGDVEQTPAPTGADMDAAVLLLGAGMTAATHPLLYVKLLIQVGHEPLPPTVGTTMFGRRVLYLPGFFSYAQHIVKVDGKRGLFRGLSPRIASIAISTVIRTKAKKGQPVSKKDDLMQTPLRKVMKETSHEMVIQCLSKIATHPFHVMSVRCMAQFVGREVKYSGIFSSIGRIFKEEGVAGFYVGLMPHMLGEVLFLWCCNLLAHFINTYAVDDSFSQASAVRSYTKFVMGFAVSILTYPFMLVADVMAVNNCGLTAGLPPHSPIFTSWLHCWNYLSHKGLLFRGSSFFSRRVPVTSINNIIMYWTAIVVTI